MELQSQHLQFLQELSVERITQSVRAVDNEGVPYVNIVDKNLIV